MVDLKVFPSLPLVLEQGLFGIIIHIVVQYRVVLLDVFIVTVSIIVVTTPAI